MVGRPRTPIGTYGDIHVTEVRSGVWEARARFRGRDGKTRRLRRRGHTRKTAERALKTALSELMDEVAGRTISGSTSISRVAELWLAEVEDKVERGERAAKSLYDYRTALNRHLVPRIGDLACRELTPGICDEVIKSIRTDVGPSTAKRARVVLSGICGHAVRHGGMQDDPTRSIEQIETGERREIQTLDLEQRRDLLARLRTWTEEKSTSGRLGPRGQVWADLPEVVEAMLSTGARIGEILAITGEEVDPTTGTVVLSHHLVWIKGQGIVRQPLRKSGEPALTLRVPSWSVPMWRRRKLESGGGLVFPAWNGEPVDPSNVTKRFRTACDAVGYDWVTSHTLRRTVATHLGDADLASTAIADQLGNTVGVVETHYRRKRVANESVADHLESIMDGG